jgi:amidase
MPFFGQEDFEVCQKKGPLTEKAYLDALAKCRKLSRDEGIDAVPRSTSWTPSSRLPQALPG